METLNLSLFSDCEDDWIIDAGRRIDDLAMAERAKEVVAGVDYLPDYIGRDEEVEFLRRVDAGVWSGHWQRRTQSYGRRYRDTSQPDSGLLTGLTPDDGREPLPDWTDAVRERLVADGIFGHSANQMGINEYLPGQGIAPHVDYHGGEVVSITLGTACLMDFSRIDGPTVVSTWLAPRSMVVLKGEARSAWRHGIARRKSDVVNGTIIARGRRVSITFRYIV